MAGRCASAPANVLFIPRGRVHHFANLGTQDARELSMITPGLLGPEYFRTSPRSLDAGGPPNIERIMEVMKRHGRGFPRSAHSDRMSVTPRNGRAA